MTWFFFSRSSVRFQSLDDSKLSTHLLGKEREGEAPTYDRYTRKRSVCGNARFLVTFFSAIPHLGTETYSRYESLCSSTSLPEFCNSEEHVSVMVPAPFQERKGEKWWAFYFTCCSRRKLFPFPKAPARALNRCEIYIILLLASKLVGKYINTCDKGFEVLKIEAYSLEDLFL